MRNVGFGLVRTTVVLGAFALSTLASNQVRAHGDEGPHRGDKCSALVGPFESRTGPPCTSPIGLCTHGMLQGEFSATYDFTFATLNPAGDPNDPTKSVYTGTSVVTATDGSGALYTNDTGVIHIPADGGPAPFVTKAIVDRGTQRYTRSIGGFVATGSLVFQTGEGTGSYSAVLCEDKE